MAKKSDSDTVVSFSTGSIDSATPAEWDAVSTSYTLSMNDNMTDGMYQFDTTAYNYNPDNVYVDLDGIDVGSIDISFSDETKPDYKFREDELIAEFKSYIDSTYAGHYSKNKFQSTEVIIERGHGTGFCMGNIDKYSNRYGNKGTRDDARKDLMKVLHYALIQLYIHDMETDKLEKA